ncbi:MAG: hypothetical protein KC657_36580 [Myxococcales bacterium]|nr:hypothetical protein [Myxococcales bacterium]
MPYAARRRAVRLVSVTCVAASAWACGAFSSSAPGPDGGLDASAAPEGAAVDGAGGDDAACFDTPFRRCDAGTREAGEPECVGSEVYCYEGASRVCADWSSSPNHCGACGNRCAYKGSGACVAGDCVSVVFVTKAPTGANMGGLAAADAICNTAVGNKYGKRPFRAWLSSGLESPASRLASKRRTAQPLVRPDGVVVANSWNDFVAGQHQAPINVDEAGATVSSGRAWTATGPDGNHDNKGDCNGWTAAIDSLSVTVGDVTSSSPAWTTDVTSACSLQHHLYCVQD